MKDIINDFKNFDAVEQYYSLKEIVKTFWNSYKENNSWKIRLIDSFIIFNVLLLIVQFLYVLVVGKDPMESLMSGLVCCIGSITLSGNILYDYF